MQSQEPDKMFMCVCDGHALRVWVDEEENSEDEKYERIAYISFWKAGHIIADTMLNRLRDAWGILWHGDDYMNINDVCLDKEQTRQLAEYLNKIADG